MLNLVRQRIRRLSGRDERSTRARDATVELRVPSPYGGKPWLTATVAVTTTPNAHGETLRLRAHLDGCLRLPDATGAHERLGARGTAAGSLARQGRDAAATLVRGVIDRLPAERLTPLSSRRWRSWLDVQLSTSPLDGGADALMPEPLRGMYGDGVPSAGTGQPRIGVWSGPAGGPAGGVASLALLQLDESDLGGHRAAVGKTRFNLNASLAQLVEPDFGPPDRD